MAMRARLLSMTKADKQIEQALRRALEMYCAHHPEISYIKVKCIDPDGYVYSGLSFMFTPAPKKDAA